MSGKPDELINGELFKSIECHNRGHDWHKIQDATLSTGAFDSTGVCRGITRPQWRCSKCNVIVQEQKPEADWIITRDGHLPDEWNPRLKGYHP